MIEELDTNIDIKKGEFLQGTVDCVFKAILLDPNNPDYLKCLLHEILGLTFEELENVVIENSEYVIDNKKDKKMRSDIIVSVGNRYVNIEMDRTYYKNVSIKNSAYFHKQYSTIYNSGEDYSDSKILTQICFQDFYYFEHNKEIYKFLYKEDETNEILDGKEIKYFINLAYIYDTCYNRRVNELSLFERYCLLLKTVIKEKAYEISGDDKVMRKVSERLENLSNDEKMIGLYDAEIEAEKIRKTQLKDAKNEGIKEELKKGIEQKTIEVAKNMRAMDIEDEIIFKATGLSIEKINNL